ncbi:hypothetical protein ACIBK9_16455 [Nonomuraea sp. NPDC050227]|uniref:hypothetical protein n=1 Tax=Nonomuraea sp. NPDC050227 TaxID=3364360 RepID=UPI0037A2CD05
MSLDEQLGDVAIHQDRLIHTDAFLGMLRAIGLGVAEAQIVHRDLTLRLFGFVLLVVLRSDPRLPGCVWQRPRSASSAHLDR